MKKARIFLALMCVMSLTLILNPLMVAANPIKLTNSGNNYNPSWSSDGKSFCFQSGRNGSSNIYTSSIKGKKVVRISNMPAGRAAWGPVYRPKSKDIFYLDNSPNGPDFHWLIRSSSDGHGGRYKLMMIPGGHTYSSPSFSADGGKFAFSHYIPGGGSTITIANVNGTGGNVILSDTNLVNEGAVWGRGTSNKELLFTKMVNGVKSIYTVNIDGSGEERITNASDGNCSNASWSPDGKTILYTGDDKQIYTIRVDGSDNRKITNDVYENDSARFSPDGKKILYVSKRDGVSNIYLLSLKDGGSPVATPSIIKDNIAGWTELNVKEKQGAYQFTPNRMLIYKKHNIEGFAVENHIEKITISPTSPNSKYAICIYYDDQHSGCYLLNLEKYTATKLQLGPPIVWTSWSPKSTHVLLATYYEADMALYAIDLETMTVAIVPVDLANKLQEQRFDLDSVIWTAPQMFKIKVTINCNPYTDENSCDGDKRQNIIAAYQFSFNVITFEGSAEEDSSRKL